MWHTKTFPHQDQRAVSDAVYARPICASNVGPPVGLTTTLKWNIGAK